MSQEILDELELVKAKIGTVDLRLAVLQSEVERLTLAAKKKRNAVEWFEVELKNATQWQRDLADDLRGVFLFASKVGLRLDACLKYAETIDKPVQGTERLKIEALAAIEEYKLRLISGINSADDSEETARRQRGLGVWNGSPSVTWSDVAEALDGTPETKKAVTEEIRRYAKANNLFIRKASPGAKRRK